MKVSKAIDNAFDSGMNNRRPQYIVQVSDWQRWGARF